MKQPCAALGTAQGALSAVPEWRAIHKCYRIGRPQCCRRLTAIRPRTATRSQTAGYSFPRTAALREPCRSPRSSARGFLCAGSLYDTAMTRILIVDDNQVEANVLAKF